MSKYDDEGALRPVAYFFSKHTAAECNYEIYDKELLAIIKSLEEWQPELMGTQEPFDVLTDHKNLEYFTTTKSLNQRQMRWSEFLSGFNFKIIHRPCSKATRPDALSRKAKDRADRADLEDNRVKNRQRIMLPKDVFSLPDLEELTQAAHDNDDISALPINLLLPDDDVP